MKLQTGCIVTDIRGGLGDITVSRNAYGLFARNIVTPLDPVSSFKASMRLKWAQVSQAWRALSEAQRNTFHLNCLLFTETNVFGESSKINGFNLFMRLNYNRAIYSLSILTSCPKSKIIPSQTSFFVTCSSVSQVIVKTSYPAVPSTHILFLYASRPVSAGLSQNSVRYYFVAFMSGGYPPVTSITSLYFSRFSVVLIKGYKIFFKIVTVEVASGIPSLPIYAFSIIT